MNRLKWLIFLALVAGAPRAAKADDPVQAILSDSKRAASLQNFFNFLAIQFIPTMDHKYDQELTSLCLSQSSGDVLSFLDKSGAFSAYNRIPGYRDKPIDASAVRTAFPSQCGRILSSLKSKRQKREKEASASPAPRLLFDSSPFTVVISTDRTGDSLIDTDQTIPLEDNQTYWAKHESDAIAFTYDEKFRAALTDDSKKPPRGRLLYKSSRNFYFIRTDPRNFWEFVTARSR